MKAAIDSLIEITSRKSQQKRTQRGRNRKVGATNVCLLLYISFFLSFCLSACLSVCLPFPKKKPKKLRHHESRLTALCRLYSANVIT